MSDPRLGHRSAPSAKGIRQQAVTEVIRLLQAYSKGDIRLTAMNAR